MAEHLTAATGGAPQPTFQIHLFGGLRMLLDGAPFTPNTLPRTLPLLAYLLLHGDHPLTRAAVAFALWPDVGEAEARANLRRHLYDLRQALPPEDPTAPWLLATAGSVQWNPAAPVWVDAVAFLRLTADPQRWADAVNLYHGDLLPGLQDEWLVVARQQFAQRYADCLSALIDACGAAGERSRAIEYAVQLLAHDPLREDVVRTLMTLRFEAGDRTGALHEYRQFEQRLRSELNVAPMVETSALYDAIARQLAAPAAPTTPAPVAPTAPAFNLPAQLTSFIGRQDDIAAVQRLLIDDGVRLLTLTGPGGSGKTRLALTVGEQLHGQALPRFADGVYAVMLAAVTEPARLPAAVADALGVKEQRGEALTVTLQQWLRDRRLLLILDNFEQLAAGAPFVADLLSAAPQLTVLVTSRTLLRIYGECEVVVAPLPLPAPEEYDDPVALTHYAAVNLFVTRSRAVNPNFTLNAGNAAAIAGLCARLDGLPLAIELAAARSKLFSPQAMLARLRDQLTFFTDQRLPPRQRTLRATLDWSYALLGADEQRLLARLAIFTGRFELEAAEAVCAIDGDIDVFGGIAALLDHSPVQRVEESADAAVSLRLLSTVQQYALLMLSAAEADRIRDQHLLYYAALVESGYVGLTSGAQTHWLARLAAADENIQAALAWALRDDAPPAICAAGATIAAQLGRYWEMRGRLSEGWAWLEQARQRRAHLPGVVHLRLLNQTASLAQMLGRLDAAQAILEEALVLSQQVDEPRLRGVTLHLLGLSAGRAGDLVRADELLSECLALYRRTPEITSTDMSALLNNLAIVTTRRGDFARTQALLTEALGLAQRRGDVFSTAHILSSLGDLAQRQGDLATAGRHHRESLRLRQTIDNRTGMLTSLQNLANLTLACGDLPLAVRLCAASDALRQTYAVQLTGHMADDFRTNVATLRTALGEGEFTRLWDAGAALTLEDAARLALQD